jgi:hypothetical protein
VALAIRQPLLLPGVHSSIRAGLSGAGPAAGALATLGGKGHQTYCSKSSFDRAAVAQMEPPLDRRPAERGECIDLFNDFVDALCCPDAKVFAIRSIRELLLHKIYTHARSLLSVVTSSQRAIRSHTAVRRRYVWMRLGGSQPVSESISVPRRGSIIAAAERQCPRHNSEMVIRTTYDYRPGLVFVIIERDDGQIDVSDAARYFAPTEERRTLDRQAYEEIMRRALNVECCVGRHASVLTAAGCWPRWLDVAGIE